MELLTPGMKLPLIYMNWKYMSGYISLFPYLYELCMSFIYLHAAKSSIQKLSGLLQAMQLSPVLLCLCLMRRSLIT